MQFQMKSHHQTRKRRVREVKEVRRVEMKEVKRVREVKEVRRVKEMKGRLRGLQRMKLAMANLRMWPHSLLGKSLREMPQMSATSYSLVSLFHHLLMVKLVGMPLLQMK